MKKIKWVKQLTRENTLLDRSLRAIAYRQSLAEIGKANMSNVLLAGQGRVTSLYYLPDDYARQQQIILREFKDKNIGPMSRAIIKFLEQGFSWANSLKNKKLSAKELQNYYNKFNLYHAHARGAVVYGYWGEPLVTKMLKEVLSKKVTIKELDHTLSLLSSPRVISGPLEKLRSHSMAVEKRKADLLKKLKLSGRGRELAEILSWFTLFYEMGELVSSFLYDQLLSHLKQAAKSKKEFEDLMWYDPASLGQYLAGSKLKEKELKTRQESWIIEILNGKWKFLTGAAAKQYRQRYLETEKIKIQAEIKGTCASLGKARGAVKIIVTQNDQKKMKRGDILISPMTTPRLMAAVKLAGAIVTDEGGMTAHAAIVAREFNIPCVVGTKIATKVFKDGDLVEVDANKGVVRKMG